MYPAPPVSKASQYYSAPRTAPPAEKGAAGGPVHVNYSPNTPTPGGASNGQSPKQDSMK